MQSFVQLAVSGLAMGFIYCLVAVEYTLIWNATGLINFAHERFIVLGAFFFGGTMMQLLPGGHLVGAIATMVFMAIYGLFVSFIIINPLRNMPTLFAVMGMLMLGNIMREGIRLIWGSNPFTVPNFLAGTIRLGGIALPYVYVIIILVSILLLIAQRLFMTRTKTGKAVRCVAQDKEAAAMMGINVRRNIAITVAISSAICGLIGILVIPLFAVDHGMAATIALKGFASGLVGGFGTYSGAIVGGLIIGVVENVYLLFGPSVYKDVVAFVLLIVFLMIKPNGIMGDNNGETLTESIQALFASSKAEKRRGEV